MDWKRVVFLLVVAVLLCLPSSQALSSEQDGQQFEGFAHCPNRCSGHGICSDNICQCGRGWTGEDCGTKTCSHACHNGGICINTTCSCPDGFAGVDCALTGCPNGCSGHGTCTQGQCECHGGFTGHACETEVVGSLCPNNCSRVQGHGECVSGRCYCHDSWAGEDCSKHVCINSCSGHGSCVTHANTSRCECHPGFTGNDCSNKECRFNCGAHGECDDVSGECVCAENWEGEDCAVPVCHPRCSDHGQCTSNNTNKLICACDEGWAGPTCHTRTCQNNCNYRGVCESESGVCRCPPEYSGDDCSFTAVGNKHMRGCSTRAHCNDHGLCVHSHCKCMTGWYGDHCQHAFANRTQSCPNGCSGHGLCNYQAHCICVFPATGADCDDMECEVECSENQRCVGGTCVCLDTTKAGPNCDHKLCPNGCSHHGKCHTNNGTCECDEGYTGSDCSARECPSNCGANGLCLSNFTCHCHDGFAQPDCISRTCPNDCSAHGVCKDAQCLCEDEWWGLDCSQKRCGDQLCSGHGVCRNGTCECSFGWFGETCQNQTCPRACNAPRGGECLPNNTCKCKKGFHGVDCFMMQPVNVSCPNQCSDHGHCVSQSCVCQPGWTGEGCEIPVCHNDCHEFESRGVCNGSRVCECLDGFHGLWCEKVACRKGCSEPNGFCNTTTGICECIPGRSGLDCSVRDETALANCNAHGVLDDSGNCKCNDGWTGFMCEEKRCPEECSGNGMCANGTCLCDPGFEGSGCEYGSAKPSPKRNCNRRCALSCVPRCKHVHEVSYIYGDYKHLDNHTALFDKPNATDWVDVL